MRITALSTLCCIAFLLVSVNPFCATVSGQEGERSEDKVGFLITDKNGKPICCAYVLPNDPFLMNGPFRTDEKGDMIISIQNPPDVYHVFANGYRSRFIAKDALSTNRINKIVLDEVVIPIEKPEKVVSMGMTKQEVFALLGRPGEYSHVAQYVRPMRNISMKGDIYTFYHGRMGHTYHVEFTDGKVSNVHYYSNPGDK